MEEINELIRRYHLKEDGEHVIIPFKGENGNIKHCYLLKRRFIRIEYPEGHYVDYPLPVAIEATIRYPEVRLSEAICMINKESSGKILSGDAGDTDTVEPNNG
ncbi:hypothetical protein BMS3Abin07_01914 [bacterium BMS3Abin07]|nr:hypothetical protein BMS3Abin07_01914 [bacterium BMS3Abin07]GBE32086.1 hypothetical protein BMS3Bbin05_00994 [bacterium BMS3Bbin05]HDL20140.1 hypothetical protein [Nitrospirota bacterium]HDO23396.1 hypothetical protein [Nitrospirota bacterium]HDZ88310.1 hypothetical protein [Nitrospirota bacterium]